MVSGKIDGELSTVDERELDIHLDSCDVCRNEFDELLKLKEVTSKMRFSDLPDRFWAGYWNDVYNKIERGLGWIFLSIGAIILLLLGAWQVVDQFLLNDSISILVRFGFGIGIIGVIVLLVSLGRERLFARKHERYEEVER